MTDGVIYLPLAAALLGAIIVLAVTAWRGWPWESAAKTAPRQGGKSGEGREAGKSPGSAARPDSLAGGLGDALQTTVSNLPDAVMVLGRRLEINWANQAAADWFGVAFGPGETAEQVRANPAPRLPEVLRGTAAGAWLAAGDYQESFDCAAPGAPGVDIRIRVVPFRHGQFLLQARDVTQVKNLEMVRRDFVANTSHELRTPVSILYGYLDMMVEQDAGIDAQWKPAIRQMHEQTRRIAQIIDDMMMLSSLEHSESPPHQYLEMAPLLESARRDAVALSGRRRHRIDTALDANYSLHCNPKEIESLVANLISNAVRYTPARGRISIHWDVDLGGGVLSVRDTGIGIGPADIPRLTERFYRSDPARSRETGGTGLGLAIVNHVVTRHDAKLLIESKPRKGSCFSVHFPTARIRKDHDQVNLLLN